ncbi:MAG: glutathione peroxidase [Oceanospirillaceae bacterium]|nr:glutathione peroxidase [Oceanospirillaceae bacterium]
MRYLSAALLAFAFGGSLQAAECPELLNHDLRKLASEEEVNLCEAYRGKVLLVVNTASKCGFTDQYEGLEALYADYQSDGLVVLGFPSNDFAGQEPGTEAEIQNFCRSTYSVRFPMFAKTVVRGEATSPFWRDLADASGSPPKWNFNKYLIDRNGHFVAAFGSRTEPDDPELMDRIRDLLADVDKP